MTQNEIIDQVEGQILFFFLETLIMGHHVIDW